jgi:hypothetical protein
MDEHGDFKGLELGWRLMYDELNPTLQGLKRGVLFGLLIWLGLEYKILLGTLTPGCMHEGFGGDYIDNGLKAISVNKANKVSHQRLIRSNWEHSRGLC